jgi:hypothetical protein
MIYSIFTTHRYLISLVPWIYLAGVSWCATIDTKLPVKFGNILSLILIILTFISFPELHSYGFRQFDKPEVKDEWAIWAAQHIEGKVAIVEGGDILKMSESYSFTNNGSRYAIDFKNLKKKITTYRPGIYQNLENAMVKFRENNTQYIITDRYHIKSRPYLREITNKRWQPIFKKLNHFGFPQRGGVLIGVDIYKINWQNY